MMSQENKSFDSEAHRYSRQPHQHHAYTRRVSLNDIVSHQVTHTTHSRIDSIQFNRKITWKIVSFTMGALLLLECHFEFGALRLFGFFLSSPWLRARAKVC